MAAVRLSLPAALPLPVLRACARATNFSSRRQVTVAALASGQREEGNRRKKKLTCEAHLTMRGGDEKEEEGKIVHFNTVIWT